MTSRTRNADLKHRVAVASSDGRLIDQHLGQATMAWIFDVDGLGRSEFVEKRSLEPGESLDAHDWNSISRLFQGVEVVLAAQAGPGATSVLRSRNILTLAVTGPIDRAVTAFGRRGWMIGNEPPRGEIPDGCSGSSGKRNCT